MIFYKFRLNDLFYKFSLFSIEKFEMLNLFSSIILQLIVIMRHFIQTDMKITKTIYLHFLLIIFKIIRIHIYNIYIYI